MTKQVIEHTYYDLYLFIIVVAILTPLFQYAKSVQIVIGFDPFLISYKSHYVANYRKHLHIYPSHCCVLNDTKKGWLMGVIFTLSFLNNFSTNFFANSFV